MITNISSTPNTLNVNRTFITPVKVQNNSFKFAPKYDEVSFSGNIIKTINQTKDAKEIRELVKLFHTSFQHSVDGKMPKPSKFWIVNKYKDLVLNYVVSPFVWSIRQSDSLTEVVRGKNNKLLGGYSMFLDKGLESSAYVSFMTIAPELKKTKASREIILKMAERICDNAKAGGVNFISGTVHVENKPMRNTLKKLNAIEIERVLDNIEFELKVDDLKKALDKLRNTKS